MEEKKEVTHSLHLEQRGHGLVTGVTEICLLYTSPSPRDTR